MRSSKYIALTLVVLNAWLLRSQSKAERRIKDVITWTYSSEESSLEMIYDTLNFALSLAESKGDYKLEVMVLSTLSSTALKRGKDIERAGTYLEKIRRIANENNRDPWCLARYHNGLGLLYYTEGLDRDRAYREFKTSRKIIETNDLSDDPVLLNNFALALMNDGQIAESMEVYKEAYKIYRQQGALEPYFEFNNILNRGVNFIYLGEEDSVRFYFELAKKIAKTTASASDDFEAGVYMGVFLQEQGEYKLSIQELNTATKYINDSRSNNLKVLLFESLSTCYSKLGQYESAYNALFDRERYVDSLDLQGFVEQSLRFDYKRELDSIQHEQELQNLKSSVERDRLRFRVSILVLSILLILGGLSFVVFRLNKKRQLNAVIAENERLEKERIKKEKELELLRKEEQIVSQEIELGVREFELSNLKRMLQDHLDRSNDPDFNEMKIFLSQIRNSEKKVAHLGSLNNILSMNSSDFLKNLKMKHPNLTDDELRLLSLIRLNLGTDELTLIFNISRASLNTKRYRVRKKLGLSSSDSLDSYILAF